MGDIWRLFSPRAEHLSHTHRKLLIYFTITVLCIAFHPVRLNAADEDSKDLLHDSPDLPENTYENGFFDPDENGNEVVRYVGDQQTGESVEMAGKSGLVFANMQDGSVQDAGFAGLTEAQVKEVYDLYEVGRKLLADTRSAIESELVDADPGLKDEGREIELMDRVEGVLHEQINSNLLGKDDAPHGRVEINAFESGDRTQTFVVIRAVHEATEKSIIFSDVAHFIEELRHFRKKYVGRQAHIAQRDLIHMEFAGENLPEFRNMYEVPESMFTLHYWRTYWHAIWVQTSRSDKIVGGICTAGELAMYFFLFDLPSYMTGVSDGIPWGAYGIKAAFGTALGVYLARTMQTWLEVSPRLRSALKTKRINVSKRNVISFFYGLGIIATTQDGFVSLNIFTTRGVLNWIAMITNMSISNTLKDEVLEWVKIRSRLRLNSKESQKVFEAQTLRVFTGFIRYVDLAMTGTIFALGTLASQHLEFLPAIAVQAGTFVASRAAYLSLTFIPLYFNHRYVSKLHRKAVREATENPSITNDRHLKNIEEELVRVKNRRVLAKKFVRNLPKNILLSPYLLFKRISNFASGSEGGEPSTIVQRSAVNDSSAFGQSCPGAFGPKK